MPWDGLELDEDWADDDVKSRTSAVSSLRGDGAYDDPASTQQASTEEDHAAVGSVMIRTDAVTEFDGAVERPWSSGGGLKDNFAPLALEAMFRNADGGGGAPVSHLSKFKKRLPPIAVEGTPSPLSGPSSATYFAANTSGNDLQPPPSMESLITSSDKSTSFTSVSTVLPASSGAVGEIPHTDDVANNLSRTTSMGSEVVDLESVADVSVAEAYGTDDEQIKMSALFSGERDPLANEKLNSLLQTLESSLSSSPGQRRAMSAFQSSIGISGQQAKRLSSNPMDTPPSRGQSIYSETSDKFVDRDAAAPGSNKRPATSPAAMLLGRHPLANNEFDSDLDEVVSVNMDAEEADDSVITTHMSTSSPSVSARSIHTPQTPRRQGKAMGRHSVQFQELPSRVSPSSRVLSPPTRGQDAADNPNMKLLTPRLVGGFLKSYQNMVFDDANNRWVSAAGNESEINVDLALAIGDRSSATDFSMVLEPLKGAAAGGSKASAIATQDITSGRARSSSTRPKDAYTNRSRSMLMSTVNESAHEEGSESLFSDSVLLKQRLSRAISNSSSVMSVLAKSIPSIRWRQTVVLALPKRGIHVLDGLDVVMPDLKQVDLSYNQLTSLSGLPRGISDLIVAGNRLSSAKLLRPFTTLRSVDVSGNKIKSLSGLSCFLTLTELRADDCGIESLAGLADLQGLATLSLARNRLTKIDADLSQNPHLRELNVGSNALQALPDLASLSKLSVLIADRNELTRIECSKANQHLTVLRLSYNKLCVFNCALFPHLTTLYLDCNRLHHVAHIENLTRMTRFSARSQRGNMLRVELSQFARTKDLYLAGNPFYSIREEHLFPNMEFLELSSCSLTRVHISSPTVWSNLLVLNLNHNGIKDIRPLRHLPKLRNLLLFGNRIHDVASVEKLVTSLPNLETLDMRYNPCTMMFYAPLEPSENHALCFNASAYQTDAQWVERDARFRGYMDDLVSLERNAYRNRVMYMCGTLIELDGIAVMPAHHEQCAAVLNGIQLLNRSVAGLNGGAMRCGGDGGAPDTQPSAQASTIITENVSRGRQMLGAQRGTSKRRNQDGQAPQ